MNRSSCLQVVTLALALAGCGQSLLIPIDSASVDSARVDAADRRETGVHDGDVDDAGSDTGTGVFDTGVADTGTAMPDTGMLDVGTDDAGLLDVGIFGDGSLPDAAIADAAISDAAGDGGPHLGPAPVILGPTTDLSRAGAYVLIGKTGITNVTGTLISGGHLGVSPILSPAITGFSLILDSSGQFSTSVSVAAPWRVYAADYAVPTPTNLTSAILDMEGAYSDAASRVLPDFLNHLDGHIGGLVLVPGLYTWMTSVDVTAAVTFAGGANDVWILQVTNDVDLSAATRMLLAGGAQASNIFWQVAGQVTMHAGSHFEGVILCQTGITMQTGASLHGRALAQTLVALDDDMITAP